MRASPLLSVIASAFALGCAVPSSSGPSLRGGDVRPSHMLTAEHLARSDFATAYQAVAYLRPQFLRARGPAPSGPGVLVYLNGTKLGGIDALHQIQASGVTEIRYLPAPEATTRFGSNHPAGAIIVTLGVRRPEAW